MNYALATVILVGLTIAIALAAVAWIMGVWTSEQQQFIVRPILRVIAAGTGLQEGASGQPVLVLYVENSGASAVKILRVEIRGSEGFYFNDLNLTIGAGEEKTITIDSWGFEGNPPPLIRGHMYRVVIYTDKLGMIFYDVVAG